ncbi:MAG: methyltransferase domain-containing protein [Gemmatimonadota bacterium]|jgi:SAM-dependent methyltransferase
MGFYQAIRPLFYLGNRFICPCCGGRFRKLRPFGVRRRQNAWCPKCGSLERHRLLWLFLRDRTNLFSEDVRLLHFAPEKVLQDLIAPLHNVDYTSADLDSPHAMTAVDIVDLPWAADTFDAILCSHVLEHVPDDRRAMRELLRVLKPGGWAILQVPVDRDRPGTYEDPAITSPEERERAFGQHDHVRVYGLDYADRLEEAGFAVNVDGYVRTLPPAVAEKHALWSDEDIYFCSKPHNHPASFPV